MNYKSLMGAIITIGLLIISNTSSACYQYSGKTLERKAARFSKAINNASRKYNVNADLIKAIITVESCFNPRARGSSGEKGLMQLMPGTARLVGVRSNYNSWTSIHGGTKYLKSLLRRYKGNKAYAAAAYNGGPGAVSKKYGPRFSQVRRYSSRVMRAYSKLSGRPAYRGGKSRNYKDGKPRKYRSRNRTSKTYRVRRGNSLAKIAAKTGVSVRRLKQLNRLKSSRIRAGSRLKIKSKLRKSKSNNRNGRARTHRVKRGDSLSKIALKTGVSVKRLKRLNRLKSSRIKIGTRLKVR